MAYEIKLSTEEIVKQYEEGVKQIEIAKKYGISEKTINARIRRWYRKTGKKNRVLRSSQVIIEYLEKGVSIEDIKLIALESNVIIPEEIMKKAIDKVNAVKKSEIEEDPLIK